LPFSSQGNLENAESALLLFIKLLLSNVQNGNNFTGKLKNDTRRLLLKPSSNNSVYKSKFWKICYRQKFKEKLMRVKRKNSHVYAAQPFRSQI
jgi:hypothetical protein